jgi:hypothetical protein
MRRKESDTEVSKDKYLEGRDLWNRGLGISIQDMVSGGY